MTIYIFIMFNFKNVLSDYCHGRTMHQKEYFQALKVSYSERTSFIFPHKELSQKPYRRTALLKSVYLCRSDVHRLSAFIFFSCMRQSQEREWIYKERKMRD